ncbi:MAG: hypothetical protein AMDU5_GPLC00015G0036 [Thermoplasmatales archaeon Gpl]|nr:MAG: hypothetical protein AMDU5_GPLC00015G0036 [Thermoplasmatales archaeon Gpl]
MDRSVFELEVSCLQNHKTMPSASKYINGLNKWMNQKEFSEGYKSDIIRYLKPIEYIEINSDSEMRDIVSKSPSTMVLTVMRAYINFLHESDIIDEDTASYFRKALPSRKTNSDGYVPADSDIKEAYDKIKKGKGQDTVSGTGILRYKGN